MGTDIMKVTYSDSWRPGSEFLDWILENMGYTDPPLIRFVPAYWEDPAEGARLRANCPAKFREELEKLLRDYGGHDIAVG